MRRRLLKILLWTAIVFLLLAALVVSLALFTPLPDHVATRLVQRALDKTGGTLLYDRREGSLVNGLDLYGVELKVPGHAEFTAAHVHCQLRVFPLAAGVIVLRDVRADSPRLVLTVAPPEGKGGKPYRNPDWLNLWAPGAKISKGYFELRRVDASGATTSMVFSDIETEARLSALGQLITAELKSLSVAAPAPFPPKVSVSGKVGVTLNKTLRLDASVETPKSEFSVKGTYDLTPGDESFRAHLVLTSVDLPEAAIGWQTAPKLLVSGQADVSGDVKEISWKASVRAEGLGPVDSSGRLEIRGKSVTVSGDARTQGALLAPFWKTPPGKGARVAGKASWKVLVAPGAPVGWSAKGQLERSSVWGLQIDQAAIEASGTPQTGRASGHLASPSSGPLEASVEWDVPGETWDAKLAGEQVPLPDLLRQLDIDLPVPSPLMIPQGTWNVRQSELKGAPSGVTIAATLDDPSGAGWDLALGPLRSGGPIAVDARATGLDPEKWGLRYAGRLQGAVSLRGPSIRDAVLDLDLGASRWAGYDIRPFKAEILLKDGGYTLKPLDLRTSLGTASVEGTLGAEGSLQGKATLSVPDLALLKTFLKEKCPSGSLDFGGTLAGSLKAPNVDGRAVFKKVAYQSLSAGSVVVSGKWETAGGGTDLKVDWEDLSGGDTALGVGSLDMQGGLDAATLTLNSTFGNQDRHLKATAKGTLGIERVDLALSGITLELGRFRLEQKGQARLTWNPEAVAWSDLELFQYKSDLALSGRLGLSGPIASAPISGTVRAKHLPLKLLPIPNTAGTIAGHVDADFTWSGTLSDPQIEGQGRLDNGYYLLPNSDLAIDPITATVEAHGNKLVLTGATATTGEGGKAGATGYMTFKGFLPTEYSVTATGKAFPFVIGHDMTGISDFNVTLKGTLEKPQIEGTATVVKGRILLPEISRQQPIPASIRFKSVPRGSPLERQVQAESGPSVVGPLRGAVQLEAPGGLWVSNRSLLAEMSGKITVRFTEKGLAVSGGLTIENGRYLFQGKKFEIQTSHLAFKGTTELNPYLDLNAYYRAGEYDIYVHIKGPADKPELSLSSKPPMGEGDILSVLLFGRKQEELNSQQSQDWSAAALGVVGQYQASPLLGEIQDKLGLETLSVGAGSQGGTQIGFSKQLGEKIVVEYHQTFGAVPEQRVDLRYRVNRHVSLQTDSSSLGRSGVDVFWEQSY